MESPYEKYIIDESYPDEYYVAPYICLGTLRLEKKIFAILKNGACDKIKPFLDNIKEKEEKYDVCSFIVSNYMDHITPEAFRIILMECDFFIGSFIPRMLFEHKCKELFDIYFEFGPIVISKLIEQYQKEYKDTFKEYEHDPDFEESYDSGLHRHEKHNNKLRKRIGNILNYLKPNRLS